MSTLFILLDCCCCYVLFFLFSSSSSCAVAHIKCINTIHIYVKRLCMWVCLDAERPTWHNKPQENEDVRLAAVNEWVSVSCTRWKHCRASKAKRWQIWNGFGLPPRPGFFSFFCKTTEVGMDGMHQMQLFKATQRSALLCIDALVLFDMLYKLG